MDSTRNLDPNWLEVVAHISAQSPTGSRYAAPYPFRHVLRGVIPLNEISKYEIDDFEGLVLHKGQYEEIDASFLNHFFTNAKPTFANAVFVVLEMNGQALPQRHKHLRLIPKIRQWAHANARPAMRDPSQTRVATDEQMDSEWAEVVARVRNKSAQGQGYVAPPAMQAWLKQAVSHADLAVQNPDEFSGLVLHKGLYREIDPSFLHRFLQRTIPTFANPVFILFETTGQALPQRHKHLTTLSAIKIWAELDGATEAARGRDAQRLDATFDDGDAAILSSMAAFIADRLAKPIDLAAPNFITAIAETAERFNDSSWFWVDDTGKSAELFAVPRIRDAHPKLADAMLDFIIRLSPGGLIHRRAAAPELTLINPDPKNFAAHNSFFNLAGDLSKGIIFPSIRYNDDRTRKVVRYGKNTISFRYRRRHFRFEIEDAIVGWGIKQSEDKFAFWHTSTIFAPRLIGAARRLCDVTYSYTLWRDRPTIALTASVSAALDARLEDVELSTAFDQISPERGFKTAITGLAETFESYAAPETPEEHPSKSAKVTLRVGPADYLSFYESSWMPGFANGIHTRFERPHNVKAIFAQGSRQRNFHWVSIAHDLGVIGGGEENGISEARLLTGGGYYDKPAIYRDLIIAAETGVGDTDPSVSYDVGAELNAVAVTLLFAQQHRYRVSAPSEQRVRSLKDWYDRHLTVYLQTLQPVETGGRPRIFFRGLSFVMLSLDCMARAYRNESYLEKLQACVQLLLRLEEPVPWGLEESLFGWPELDCQVSALLALARAASWGDPQRTISSAIRRGLRAISLGGARSDPGGKIEHLHDTMLVRNESGDQDTGFWNFKLGLALRAFNAIYQMQEVGALDLDQDTLDHLELLTLFARHAVRHSLRWRDGQLEALTSAKANETNSETQPWVALGFVPAVEWTIFGKPASANTRGSSVLSPQRQNGGFNTSSPPIEVEWQCNPTEVQRLFERVAGTWEQLGSSKPHWSVLTSDDYLPSSIGSHEQEFFASGQHDVHRLVATIRRVGRGPADVKIVHEFGCGVGRVTNHLAEEFDRVIACDVSRPHLDLARAHTRRLNRNNIDYRLAQLPDFGMTDPYDVWFTTIALQHNPPPIMVMVLKRALHCLRAGGLAVFQIPTYAASYVFRADDYLASPPSPTGIEMHVLPQRVLFELVREAGCVLLEITHDGTVGGEGWLSNFVVVEKPLA